MILGKFIYPLYRFNLPDSAGNKAINLNKLQKLGLSVPKTYICDWKAYQLALSENLEILPCLAKQLNKYVDLDKSYVVRSSTNIEDNSVHSYAGQFESILDVKGLNQIVDSIQVVWASANSVNVKTYHERHEIKEQKVLMAVLIQEMVHPLYSGVALSKNPVTGADEIVVEAVNGAGTRLMQDGVMPHRWINKWDYWIEKDEQSEIPFNIIEKIVEQVKEVSNFLNSPVDLEWVYDGRDLYWVQMREITALKRLNIYSNHLSQEMMPGMLKPLSFHISAPLMSSAIIHWLSEIIGDIDLNPEDLIKTFYYRVYFNMSHIGKIFTQLGLPDESLELLIGTLPTKIRKPKFKPTTKMLSLTPSIIKFFIKNIRLRRKMGERINELEKMVLSILQNDFNQLDASQLYTIILEHKQTVTEIAYLTSLSLFLLSMYNRAQKKLLAKFGVDFSNFDTTENMPELDAYYPSSLIKELNDQYHSYHLEKQMEISSTSFDNLHKIEGIDDFLQTFEILLDRFGEFGDSGNDFSKPTWRETPDDLLKIITEDHVQDKDKSGKVRLADLRETNRKNPIFMYVYRRARDYQLLREKSSNLYTKSKMVFRYYFLAIGEHFVRQGLIIQPEDIFYLTPVQVKAAIYNELHSEEIRSIIENHKINMRLCEDKKLPTVIYGDNPPPVLNELGKMLFGVPVSMGYYTGKACVVRKFNEFTKLNKGEVLIIPYSDVTWSPLFARAGALIAESGGLLSHSSIVAREYGIPAIVSVENATTIPDGCSVTVDAHQGIIHIHNL
jgi:pyruvate,water dikinase